MKNITNPRSALALTFLLLGLLLCMGQKRLSEEALASRLAPSVLRFHILANSDSANDQQIKLEIRSLILDYMQKQLCPDTSKAETVRWVKTHTPELTALADDCLQKHRLAYTSALTVTRDYFPTRVYDGLVFPCGSYDAVRITLGNGCGHNWWCVLYPRFCFVEGACGAEHSDDSGTVLENGKPAPKPCTVSSESRETLRRALKKDDYLSLEDSRPDLQIRLKLLSFLKPNA